MCMSCNGMGKPNTTPRSTNQTYNPQSQPKTYHHRQPSGSSSGNGSRASQFGTPKIKFSGRK